MFRRIKCSKNNFCQFLQTIWNFVIFNPFVRIRNFTIALYFHLKLDWDGEEKSKRRYRKISSSSLFIKNLSQNDSSWNELLLCQGSEFELHNGFDTLFRAVNLLKMTHRANPSLCLVSTWNIQVYEILMIEILYYNRNSIFLSWIFEAKIILVGFSKWSNV